MDIRKLVERYLRGCEIKGRSDRTLINYKVNLRRFCDWYEAQEIDLTSLALEDVEDYTSYLLHEADLASTSVNQELRSLSAFLTYCKERGNCPKEIKVGLVSVQESEIEPFTDEQLVELYDACLMHGTFVGLRDYAFMRVLEETGIRLTECLTLVLDDINFQTSIISLRNTKNRKVRHAYLTPVMAQELGDYLRARTNYLTEVNVATDRLWVSTSHGFEGQPLTGPTIWRHIRSYGDKAGINIRVSPHTFRHTFARNWIMAGGDMFTLKELLGHSTLDMVLKYVKLWSKDRQYKYDKVMAVRTRNSNVKQYNRNFRKGIKKYN